MGSKKVKSVLSTITTCCIIIFITGCTYSKEQIMLTEVSNTMVSDYSVKTDIQKIRHTEELDLENEKITLRAEEEKLRIDREEKERRQLEEEEKKRKESNNLNLK